MPKVFISYARPDAEFANKLASKLDDINADFWQDVKHIPTGTNWSTAIQGGLDACDLMLLIVSDAAMKSDNVANEWQYYIDEKKPIIPLLIEPIKTHFQLRRLQYIDFYNHDFDTAFPKLQTELINRGFSVKQPQLFKRVAPKVEVKVMEDAAQQIEQLLPQLGIDPAIARITAETGYGWQFQRGSALMEVYISGQLGGYFFQVLSPIMHLPSDNLLPLFRRLLDLNLQLSSAALGTYLDVVYVFHEQEISALTAEGFNQIITTVASYADELDSQLVNEFGGRLYLQPESVTIDKAEVVEENQSPEATLPSAETTEPPESKPD